MNYESLSKVLSHALRHEPWVYELELDDDGWVEVEQVLQVLQEENMGYPQIRKADIEKMIELSDKKRHEIVGSKIRAIYGHSVKGKFHAEKAEPPEILYHGTSGIARKKWTI